MGFLWLGTYNGLLRYDGYTFKSYPGDPIDTNALFAGPVKNICMDSSGNLWVNIQGAGIAHLDLSSGRIKRYPYDPQAKTGIQTAVIIDMKLDRDGNLWMTSNENGLCKRDNKHNTFIRYPKGTKGLPDEETTVLYCGRDGRLWVGSLHNGLYVYDEKRDSFRQFKIFSQTAEPDKKLISVISQGKPGMLLIGTDDSIARVNSLTGAYETILKSPGRTPFGATLSARSILRDRQGKIWVGTFAKGLLFLDEESGETVQFLSDPVNLNSIGSNQINKIFQDENENIWVGCSNGLFKLSSFQRQINLYSFFRTHDSVERIKNVRAIFKDNHENLWIGTAGDGLWNISSAGKVKQILFDLAIQQYGYNYVNCITEDGSGNFLVGTGHGIHVFDAKQQKVIRSYFWDVEMPHTKRYAVPIWYLKLLNPDTLLVGTKDSGLICLNLKTAAYTRYDQPAFNLPDKKSEKVYSVWYIHKDREGIIWLGTSIGLAQFKKTNGNWGVVFIKPARQAFPGNSIFHIHEDNDGNLWLGFVDGCLVKFNKKSQEFRAFTTRDGLPSNVVCAILEDGHRHLWISTIGGLCVLDMNTEKVMRRYTTSDGLQGNHFYFKSCFTYKDELLFGGINGVTSFKPEQLVTSSAPAFVFITSFKLLYNDVEGVRFDSTIVVPYDKNAFSVGFASSDLTNPEKNQFAYKLLGQDKNWVEIKNQRNLTFNSLSPGTYSLLIKGTNADGVWGVPSLIRIVIQPPFWKTWWFVLLCIAAALAVPALVAIEIYKRKDAQRKQVVSELASLRTQLNPHFIFNSLGSLQHFILTHQESLALQYLSKFAQMMRMILEYSRHDIISLQQEKEFLELYIYMESLRLENKVRFEIEIANTIDPQEVGIPPMMIQPLIENSIIHGLVAKRDGGRITVRYFKEEPYLICQVEDNGVGREAAASEAKLAEKKSMALEILKERLERIEGRNGIKGQFEIFDLKDENVASGTIVVLKIPYVTLL
jgi:ligand-binding sensor domain-containing protein